MKYEIINRQKFLFFQSGFTLIEVLVYIAIVVIIVSVIIIFSASAIQIGIKIKTNAEIIDNSRRAMETMIYEIERSRSVYVPTSIFDVNPSQLSLEQTTSTPAGETATFVDFFKCGQALCLKREGMGPVSLTTNQMKLTNLTFSQLLNPNSPPSVQIKLKIESASVSSLPAYTGWLESTSTANLRGY